MKLKHGYYAVGALAATAGLLGSGCAARLAGLPAAGGGSIPSAQQAVRGAGKLTVQIPWPALGRSAQYVYGGGGAVAAVEVFLVDSLNNYQQVLIVRNPAAGGDASGSATVTFPNVLAGPVTVSVHTTSRQLLGTLTQPGVITPNSTASDAFNVEGLPASQIVYSVMGDQTTPFVAFRSSDLLGIVPGSASDNGGPHPYLTQSTVYSNRSGDNEMIDGGSQMAGYGLGSATASVSAGGTTAVTVNVAQPPMFASSIYNTASLTSNATFSAGQASMTLPIATASPGDVLLATDSVLTSDVVDLSKNIGATYSVQVGTSSISFSTDSAIPATAANPFPDRNLYLLRGTMVSLQNLVNGNTPPTMCVVPALVDPANSSVTTQSLALGGGSTATVVAQFKDQFGNPVNNFGSLAVQNNFSSLGAALSGSVAPTLNLASSSLYIPGLTYGTIGSFSPTNMATNPGQWQATYKQGSISSTVSGASQSIAPTSDGGGNITDINTLVVPYSAYTALGTTPASVSLTFATTPAATLSANSGSLSSAFVTGTNALPTTGFPATWSIGQNVLDLAASLTSADSGAYFNIPTGVGVHGFHDSRAVGDTDTLTLSIPASGSFGAFSASVPVTWQ